MKNALLIMTLMLSFGLLTGSIFAQTPADIKQQLYLFNQVVGGNVKLGVLCSIATHQSDVQNLVIAGKAYKMEVYFFDVKTPFDLDKGFSTLLSTKNINALLVIPDPQASSKNGLNLLIQKCKQNRMPMLAQMPEAVSQGALMSVIKLAEGLQILVNKARATELGIQFSAELAQKVQYVE